MKAFGTLFKTEAKLALRGGDMLLFGIIFPIGIMLLIGFISSPQAVQLGFGGIAAIGICAAGVMGIPLTFATYRYEKILKRFKVTPVSPLLLFLAVSLVQIIFAVISGLGVFLIARFVFAVEILGPWYRYILTFLFVMASIFSIGYLIAALAPNVKTANLVCTVVYFPMLFLSGATVPFEIMPRGLRIFSEVFPLTQGIMLLKGAVLGDALAPDLPRFLILAGIAAVSYTLALVFFRWE